jgi:dihydropyrimidinase
MIIRGGTVVTAEGRCTADVQIKDGRITAVGLGLQSAGDPALDASGCYVLPGAIDPHTHIEMPAGGGTFNADTWHSGTVAAAFGGTTTVLDMITPEQGGSLAEALADWQGRAGPEAVVDYGFHMGIIDPRSQVLAEIPAMVAAGVPSFKLYLAYPGRLMLEDRDAFRAMQAVARADGLVLVHAENGGVIEVLVAQALAHGHTDPRYHAETRPAVLEAEATARACRLAELAGTRLYMVHVTCREALAEVARARHRGQSVLAETGTHYLLFTAADLDREEAFDGARWVLSPGLRTAEDQFALWQALGDGKLDTVASDHCPWMLAQKRLGLKRFDLIPNGIPGVEERLPFLYTYGVELGGLSLEQLVALTSTNPARIFGLYPHKGRIAPGADADLVVWDPAGSAAWTALAHHCGCDHSPYEGMTVHGRTRHVLVRGRPVVRDGEFVGEAGYGRFVRR